jgi:hypothetical protein
MSANRRNEAGALMTALQGGVWPHLERELEQQRARLVESLISENSEELRGRIKQIDDLLRLPNTLRQELNDPLPE